jgi:hypothetical protein
MKTVVISTEFGIVVRTASLNERGLHRDQLLQQLEAEPLDENDELMSFGPHFGGEAADEFRGRLYMLGLEYGNDFFIYEGGFPDWCTPCGRLNLPKN